MANLPVLIEDLPRCIPRPVQWARLLRNLKALHDGDPAKILDAAYAVGDAIGGLSEERQLRRILATPEGQELWARGSSLTDALADHDALARLPDGSLGRAFLVFCQRHGLNSRALVEHQHAMSRDYARLDPVRQWFNDRLVVMHDVWHVLLGYDATNAGESALMCFMLPHRFNDRALPIFITMSLFTGRISRRNAWEAFVRGRRAELMVAAPFEDLLAMPLEAARERLGITPLDVGHPVVTSEAMLNPAEAHCALATMEEIEA
jgi:ubiquinone biosynthesis protein COQ4